MSPILSCCPTKARAEVVIPFASLNGPDGRLLALVNPYGLLRHSCPATVLTPSSAGALLTAHHRDVQFSNNGPGAASLLKLQHSFNYRNDPDSRPPQPRQSLTGLSGCSWPRTYNVPFSLPGF